MNYPHLVQVLACCFFQTINNNLFGQGQGVLGPILARTWSKYQEMISLIVLTFTKNAPALTSRQSQTQSVLVFKGPKAVPVETSSAPVCLDAALTVFSHSLLAV